MSDLKHKNKRRRKARYDDLRAVGYTAKEANRYKDMKDAKIDTLIKSKILANKEIKRIVGDC